MPNFLRLFKKFKKSWNRIPSFYRLWLLVLVFLLIMVPLTLWGLITGDFELRKRAATGEVRGYVFLDSNLNQQEDPGESRLVGILVYLYRTVDGSSERREVVTYPGGMYGFTGLSPGYYYLTLTSHYSVVGGNQNFTIYENEIIDGAIFGVWPSYITPTPGPPSCNEDDKGIISVEYYTRGDGYPGLRVTATSSVHYQDVALKLIQAGTDGYFIGDSPIWSSHTGSVYQWYWEIVQPPVDNFKIEFYINKTPQDNGEQCGEWGSSQAFGFKLRLEGVDSRPVDDNDKFVVIYATSSDGGPNIGSAANKEIVTVSVDDAGIYHGEVALTAAHLNHHYRLRVKGPKHLQAVFPDVVFQPGVELDLTSQPLRPGDLNLDRRVNAEDLQLINERMFSTVPGDVAVADVNLDRRVDIIDRTLVLNTLSVQYDPD